MITWREMKADPIKRASVRGKWFKFQIMRSMFEPNMIYRRLFEDAATGSRLRAIDIPHRVGRPSRYHYGEANLDIIAVEIERNTALDKPDGTSGAFHFWRMIKKHGIDPEIAEEWPIIRFDRPDTGGFVFIQIRERLTNGKEIKRFEDIAGD